MRAREAREQGLPLDEEEEQPASEGGWRKPDLGSMSRYGGGRLADIDVYTRRRIVAGLAVVFVLLLLFLLLGGC